MWSLLPARAHETQVALRRSESRGADSPGRKGIWGSVRVGGKVVHCRPGVRVTAFFRETPLTSTIIRVARSGGNRTESDFRRGGGEMPSLPVADARACALGAGRGLGECTNHEAGVVAKALGLLERTSCATQKPKPPEALLGPWRLPAASAAALTSALRSPQRALGLLPWPRPAASQLHRFTSRVSADRRPHPGPLAVGKPGPGHCGPASQRWMLRLGAEAANRDLLRPLDGSPPRLVSPSMLLKHARRGQKVLDSGSHPSLGLLYH